MLMNEQKNNRCFVLLPAGDPHYSKLFHELFSIAIIEAGMVPCRLPEDSTKPFPIDGLMQEIAKADAVFADLSENSVDIWFSLGCALALRKPLCLISAKLEFSLPLDIQDLEIIPYPATPFPSDYTELEQNIIEQLLAGFPPADILAPSHPLPASPPITLLPIIPPADVVSNDLTSYEALALTLIDLKATEDGLSARALGLEMQANECAHLTSHSINALKRRKLIEKRPVQVTDGGNRYISENIFITQMGEEWLIRHGKRKNLHRSPSITRNRSLAGR
jgi:hypothetical protein